MGSVTQFTRLDAVRGAGEARTEKYSAYFEGAQQPATQHSAKNDCGVGGSAVKQAGAAGRL